MNGNQSSAATRRPEATLADYAWALQLQPVIINGWLQFNCPRCQAWHRELVTRWEPWPSGEWVERVRRLGEGPGVVADGDRWSCLRCGHRGTVWGLRRRALEDPDALWRLKRAVAA